MYGKAVLVIDLECMQLRRAEICTNGKVFRIVLA